MAPPRARRGLEPMGTLLRAPLAPRVLTGTMPASPKIQSNSTRSAR